MPTYTLRTPDDLRRLFSALGDALVHESGALSVAELDQMALAAPEDEGNFMGLYLSVLVALAAGFSAVRGYQRNAGSMPWALTWGTMGYLFPVPAVVYSAVVQRPLAP
jgi:hypothetical protein